MTFKQELIAYGLKGVCWGTTMGIIAIGYAILATYMGWGPSCN
jgi:hypothetical protein